MKKTVLAAIGPATVFPQPGTRLRREDDPVPVDRSRNHASASALATCPLGRFVIVVDHAHEAYQRLRTKSI